MTQRVRNIEMALQQAGFSSNQVIALKQAFGYNMNAVKQAVQTVSASTTLVNDDTMWTELYGAGCHEVQFYLPTTLTAAGGLKLQLVADQGLTVQFVNLEVTYFLTGVAPAVTPITALATPVNGGTTNAWTNVLITGTVCVINGGVLQLQWAQQAASGASAINAGAFVSAQLVTP
jgi:hypothetical protein